ncbi:MAG: hypothetical protein A3I26_02640 [Candidatus Yanofskybacteria bacterium RIFCSPLOWO2_02_FULL_43_10]|uniref:Uncharacterized protein n=1 Tax=Candidatus Yanofskybacteria bacterium RIFCSPLOWO2_12_FULL_43_11b TaxID=1802710 RepID=A0A1F8H8M5_9BACT|nr:MAG: hypothetical protein A2742_01570 [Candidatus Yanofskybacteria bacterium RIFCSPHIGHO2_01_FULL_43_32]OGN11627.1 MAG: hypothetical protein A3C69_01860 [Candidatus Yanofskybacteria bacterium RIFCSPHIGHO2_02_FULL_43_12]OGN25299.1 MAG: hypothetical protein A2923_01360 [Candidatus Yanofskybacteria bacterium RIFCSPLOWO2_01_FULL_43_46]OGN28584.1 MAG: hypothetical protein A3I26_02640 [Candidatus Yanofskybacteria bacterium RIFCSPLOWO2_02_FULL_43_10]OGN33894.1 MAG: hypothetical protein A3G51_01270 
MKSQKIEQSAQRSIEEVESQKLNEPGGKENVYQEANVAFEKALQIISAGLGSIEVGFDANNIEYFKLKFKDFEFYTIYRGEVEMLKSVLGNRR